ncbi:unnamed protein product [Owenia fusiformis]|uniref:Uncharacterized protein n=1 Tax=Owenia fusiformis TaxID=6347 RepID=A0A8J1U7V2_OWEFU|nr:unnamed protein product [Owenia fusiformis]
MMKTAVKVAFCFSFCCVVFSSEVLKGNAVEDDGVNDLYDYGHESAPLKYDNDISSGDDDKEHINDALNAIESSMSKEDDEHFEYTSNDSEIPLVGKIPGGKNIGKFTPIRMPTDFESYDINPTDGFVTLLELVAVTGAKENVQLAFKDSDIDGDGRLTRDEFLKAPMTLQGFVDYDIQELIKVENEIIKDEKVLKRLVKELEDGSNDTDTVHELRKALEEQRQNEIEIEKEIGKKLYNNKLNY